MPRSYPATFEDIIREDLRKVFGEVLREELRRALEVAVDTGNVTSASSNTLTDSSKNWPTDQWKDYIVEIVSGTGAGQVRRIVSNTKDTLTVEPDWTTVPDSTSRYAIRFAGVGVMSLSAWGGTALTGRDVTQDLQKLQNLDVPLGDVKSLLDKLEDALSSVGADKLRISVVDSLPESPFNLAKIAGTALTGRDWSNDFAKLQNLDVKLSEHRDALKPSRSAPVQELSGQSIAASGVAEITKTNLDGWSAIVVTVKATYDANATAGVRVRWLYSADGVNFDSPEDAEDQGNYEDLTFSAGATRQRTIVVPIFQPHVKIQIVNLDTDYAVTVDVWTTLMR